MPQGDSVHPHKTGSVSLILVTASTFNMHVRGIQDTVTETKRSVNVQAALEQPASGFDKFMVTELLLQVE